MTNSNTNSENTVNVFVVFVLAFLLLGFEAFFVSNGRPNITRSRPSARQRACFSNIRIIQGAVEMYNMDCSPMMDKLDFDILIKKKYLKERPISPETSCGYSENGKLSDGGQIVCAYHGALNPDGEKSLKEMETKKERKNVLIYILLLSIPPLFFIFYSLYNSSVSYGCFSLLLFVFTPLWSMIVIRITLYLGIYI